MIVAITGGSGFIGRQLVARHCARGDQVRYLTRQSSAGHIAGATAFPGDLTASVEQLRNFASGADILYHCAAELRIEARMRSTNILGTANLIAAMRGDVGRWVQLSSTGVYGRNVHGDVHEDTVVRPANTYEISKVAADNILREAAEQQNISCVVVRPSNVYGEFMPNQSLFQLMKIIDRGLFFFIGKPGAVANYVHVENVVDALLLCATAKLPGNGRTYIVSDHRTVEALVQTIATALKKQSPALRLPAAMVRTICVLAGGIPGFPLSLSRVDALTSRTVYRTKRIEDELGYRNRISMETGMYNLARQWKMLTTGT